MLLSLTRLDSARTTASSEALGTAPPLQLTAWLNSRPYDCAIKRVNGTSSAAQPGVDASSRLGVSGRVFAVKLLCSAGSHGEPRQPSPFPPKGTRGASPKRTRRSTLPAALERRRLLTQAGGLRGSRCVREREGGGNNMCREAVATSRSVNCRNARCAPASRSGGARGQASAPTFVRARRPVSAQVRVRAARQPRRHAKQL